MRRKIMVVDDDVSLSRLLKQSLEKRGCYEVVVENTSTLAVRRILEVMPDLVLLDIAMPDMDGGDVKYEIRQNPLTKDIPIIFLTSIVSREENVTNGGVIAGHRFLAKPVNMDELIAEIESCFKPA